MESPDREVPLYLNTEISLVMESPDREVPLYLTEYGESSQIERFHCILIQSFSFSTASPDLEVPQQKSRQNNASSPQRHPRNSAKGGL